MFSLVFILLLATTVSATQCWNYDANYTGCAAQGSSECTWSSSVDDPWCPFKNVGDYDQYGTEITDAQDLGCCLEYDCWTFDGDQTACEAAPEEMGCFWETDADDPWCTDVGGCCDKDGCWEYDDDQSTCENSFDGMCAWHADGWCDGTPGCCDPKWCGEVDNETACDQLSDYFDMPCEWDTDLGTCHDQGMSFFDGSMDDCLGSGGNWMGDFCEFPDMQGFTHCWFADNQPETCLNITGCIYCTDDPATLAAQNGNGDRDNTSSFCYQKPIGWCEGHQSDASWNNLGNTPYEYTNGALANDSIVCDDVKLKATCNFGPLPFCKWNSTTETNGNYCIQGFLSEAEQESFKPKLGGVVVDDCEDALNSTQCTFIKEQFYMPCEWDNKSTTMGTDDECTFDWDSAAFGDDKGEGDFWDIQDEDTCILAGGNWITQQVCGGGSDADTYGNVSNMFWCEPDTGSDSEDCNDACWACGNQSTCEASGLGYCAWDATDSECEQPQELDFEGGDCYDNCEFCNYFPTATTKMEMCDESPAGCQWEIDPYSNEGFCMSNTKSGCSGDCFACYDESQCIASSESCTWDSNNYFCKPSDYASDQEICFDGQDNDNDGMIDCGDPECFSDSFCGGFMMGDCFSQMTNATCIVTDSQVPGEKCVWAQDPWSDSYHCDVPGWDCWQNDDSEASCNATTACNWQDEMGDGGVMCDINQTLAESCFTAGNSTACSGAGANCAWINESWSDPWCDDQGGWCDPNPDYAQFDQPSYEWTTDWHMYCSSYDSDGQVTCDALAGASSEGADGQGDMPCKWEDANHCVEDYGWCEFKPFDDCQQLTGNGLTSANQATCNADSSCSWNVDWGDSTYGWCDPICFQPDLNETTCEALAGGGLCEARTGWCEPEHFFGGGGCAENDGNQTSCEANTGCAWFPDANAPGPDNGWCDPAMQNEIWGDVQEIAEVIVWDSTDDALPESIDLESIGIKDLGDSVGLSVGIDGIEETAFCNGYYMPRSGGIGNGTDEVKAFIYIDSDEVTTGGCQAPYTMVGEDVVSKAGFEFMVKMVSRYQNNETTDTLTWFKCDATNGVWVMTNVPLFTNKPISCGEIDAIGVAIQKEDLKGFSGYDKTKTWRLMATTANESNSRTTPNDYIDVGYYTPGTADFSFECCDCPPGTDADGDGVNVENDADCMMFKQFGFVPKEDCFSAGDDDDDGLTNCADADCYYHAACDGQQTYDPSTDFKAPKMVWHEVDVFDKGAVVMYDTDKPANGSLYFYYNDSTCGTLNATVLDVGLMDSYMEDFKNWHDGPIDNFGFNPQAIGYDLTMGETYYYKVKMCGLNDKCSQSACLSFTTAESTNFADCPMCNPVMMFDFTPPTGGNANDPMGDMQFKFKWPGETDYETQPDFCGLQVNWENLSNVDWQMSNPNDNDWMIELDNATLSGLSDDEKSLDSDDLLYVETTVGDFVGMDTETWESLQKTAPDTITLEFPKPTSGCTELWKCDEEVDSCVELTDIAGVVLLNETSTSCIWSVPGDLGFSVYGGADGSAASPSNPSSSPGGSGGGGGGGGASVKTYIVTEDILETGYTRQIGSSARFKLVVGDELYYVNLAQVNAKNVKVSFNPEDGETSELTLETGKSGMFNYDGDGYYDVKVTVNAINYTGNASTLTVQTVHEVIPLAAAVGEDVVEGSLEASAVDIFDETVVDAPVAAEDSGASVADKFRAFATDYGMFALILLVALAVGGGTYLYFHRYH